MLSGDFDAACRLNDAFLGGAGAACADDPRLPYHLRHVWDGRAFDGCDVLVRCYHGLGDTLQFMRYLPALRARVRSLTLEVQPALLPLLHDCPGADRLVGFAPAAPLPTSECDLEIMELAHALRLHPSALPPPYLRAVPASLLQGEKPVIGLCWRAGDWDLRRSIRLDDLVAAVEARDRRFIRLSPDPASCRVDFVNAAGELASVTATASLILACDIVLSVDTMVAHLAGALGRPVLLLLRRHADWRWGGGERNVWYPRTLALRQESEGDWTVPLARLRERLRAISRTRD